MPLSSYIPILLSTLLSVLALNFAPGAAAQPTSEAPEIPAIGKGVSTEQIEAGRKAAEADSSLDEVARAKTLDLYEQAGKWLQQAKDAKTEFVKIEALVAGAGARIEAIRSARQVLPAEVADIDALVRRGSLADVELALTQEDLALQQARDSRRTQAEELTKLLVGSKGLSEEISSRLQVLDRIEADLKAPPDDQPASLNEARKLVLMARRMLRQSELKLLKLKLGSHDLLTNLAQAEKDFAAVEIADREHRLQVLQETAQKLREAKAREARQEAEALQTRSEALPETLQLIARENAAYRQELEDLVGKEQTVSSALQGVRQELDGIKSDFERTRQRVDVVGPSEAIGKMLKRRRAELPSLQSYRRTSAERSAQISRATDRQIEIDELQRERSNIRAVVEKTLLLLPEEDRTGYQNQLSELAGARRDALNELQKVYSRYISQTTGLDLAERQLVEVAAAYVEYIDDQLIWIPGPGIAPLFSPLTLGSGLGWMLAPAHWQELGTDLAAAAARWPVASLLLVLLFALLMWRHGHAAEKLVQMAPQVRKIRSDTFLLTLKALGLTVVLAAPWPLLLVASGWMLGSLATASAFSLALSAALIKAGGFLGSGLLLIYLCRKDGVGDRHLRWNPDVREAVAHELSWVISAAVPLGFVAALALGNEPPPPVQAIGRLAFVVLMLLSTVFIFRLLRGGGRLMRALDDGQGGPLVQLHFLWFPPLVVVPLGFALLSTLGFHYTSVHMELLAEQTFWFFVGLFMLKELVLRSLYIAERRLRLDDAIRRRDELRAQRAREEHDGDDDALQVALDIPELDFNALSEQTRRLVRAGFLFGGVVGIWSIWSDLLPALALFNETELPFHASRVIDGVAKEVPVTLGDLVIGLVMVVVTVLAAKNIPGVLEITLLQRLPLDSGARYAITSLTQYLIAGIGVFAAFSTLGLQWSSIQWLVAALSVGLGFGLQEIVANFISGIILLFERPIRVGDVVTIDNISGKVSRIRIRATTIVNWDKQELLIPNKEFITGRVINWTLSDKINRVVVTVGVAYGTDVEKAMALMLEAACDNENVLEEPKPVASFEAFGNDALTLMLRTYLGSLEERLETITTLHLAINDKFTAAGINIAFPQRDIHLSTPLPLDVRVHNVAAQS